MFTQCPDCRKIYPVTKKQLRAKKPQIFCSDCKKKFNASALLNQKSSELVTEAKAEYIPKTESKRTPSPKKKSEYLPYSINISGFLKHANSDSTTATAKSTDSDPTLEERLPWEAENKSFNINWFVGFIIGLAILFAQFLFFESGKLSQSVAYRPTLENLCRWLGCRLADYENLAEFTVLQGSFTPNADNSIVFKAAINNQAPFKQRLPNIMLTLQDYNEQPISQRIFFPKEYLKDVKRTNFSIAPDETIEASLTIAEPKTPIGGYHFDLIY